MSADHFISDEDKFIQTIQKGIEYAEKGSIVTFGIYPKFPETGFGYIEAEEKLNFDEIKGIKIKKFAEKPNKEKAEELIMDNKYSWNSGMFLTKANVVLSEFKLFTPNLIHTCEKSIQKSKIDLDFYKSKSKEFKECQNISFDIAIMEKNNSWNCSPFKC